MWGLRSAAFKLRASEIVVWPLSFRVRVTGDVLSIELPYTTLFTEITVIFKVAVLIRCRGNR